VVRPIVGERNFHRVRDFFEVRADADSVHLAGRHDLGDGPFRRTLHSDPSFSPRAFAGASVRVPEDLFGHFFQSFFADHRFE
jgi:hypothetical protein